MPIRNDNNSNNGPRTFLASDGARYVVGKEPGWVKLEQSQQANQLDRIDQAMEVLAPSSNDTFFDKQTSRDIFMRSLADQEARAAASRGRGGGCSPLQLRLQQQQQQQRRPFGIDSPGNVHAALKHNDNARALLERTQSAGAAGTWALTAPHEGKAHEIYGELARTFLGDESLWIVIAALNLPPNAWDEDFLYVHKGDVVKLPSRDLVVDAAGKSLLPQASPAVLARLAREPSLGALRTVEDRAGGVQIATVVDDAGIEKKLVAKPGDVEAKVVQSGFLTVWQSRSHGRDLVALLGLPLEDEATVDVDVGGGGGGGGGALGSRQRFEHGTLTWTPAPNSIHAVFEGSDASWLVAAGSVLTNAQRETSVAGLPPWAALLGPGERTGHLDLIESGRVVGALTVEEDVDGKGATVKVKEPAVLANEVAHVAADGSFRMSTHYWGFIHSIEGKIAGGALTVTYREERDNFANRPYGQGARCETYTSAPTSDAGGAPLLRPVSHAAHAAPAAIDAAAVAERALALYVDQHAVEAMSAPFAIATDDGGGDVWARAANLGYDRTPFGGKGGNGDGDGLLVYRPDDGHGGDAVVEVKPDFARVYRDNADKLGAPLGPEFADGELGVMQNFERGALYAQLGGGAAGAASVVVTTRNDDAGKYPPPPLTARETLAAMMRLVGNGDLARYDHPMDKAELQRVIVDSRYPVDVRRAALALLARPDVLHAWATRYLRSEKMSEDDLLFVERDLRLAGKLDVPLASL